MKREFKPLIVASFLLLLPVLYVGSYLLLVTPAGSWGKIQEADRTTYYFGHYRWGCRWGATAYWPLEQIDRTLRPQAWEGSEGDDFETYMRSVE